MFVVEEKTPWGAKVQPPLVGGRRTEEKKVTHTSGLCFRTYAGDV